MSMKPEKPNRPVLPPIRDRYNRMASAGIRRIFRTLARLHPEKSFTVEMPDDRLRFGQGTTDFAIRFKTHGSLTRVLFFGLAGFGEGYTSGQIEVTGELRELLRFAFEPRLRSPLWFPVGMADQLAREGLRTLGLKRYFRDAQDRFGLDRRFYSQWLGETPELSCAYFECPEDDLETAQRNKYRYFCRKLRLGKGETLLNLGCDWGGLMFYAAERFGARCTGVTDSGEQVRFIREEILRRGLEGRVEVHQGDIRSVEGTFDKLVAVGILERIGARAYNGFFRQIRQRIRPGGIGLLQTIGSTDGGPVNPWVTRYVVPGAFLPTLSRLSGRMAAQQLWVYDVEDLRVHYARTLEEWVHRFEEVSGRLGQNEDFIRLWHLYLNGAAVAFEMGENHLFQLLFSTEKAARIPLTRSYIYMRGPVQPPVSA